MTIKVHVVAIFATLLGLLGAIIFTMSLMTANHESLTKSETNRFQSVKLADQLRQSSDDLTRMARTYIVTGNPTYEEYFHEIFSIRNGTAPRPEKYNEVYWDFVTETGDRPTSFGPPEALLDMMKHLGLSRRELAKLEEAKKNSDDLTKLEKIAFGAMKGFFEDASGNLTLERAPDQAFARRILHGEEYHKAKGSIMRPIREFMILVEQRTRGEVEAIRETVVFYQGVVSLLVVATILFSVFAFLHLRRRVINPVLSLAKTATRIQAGELEARASVASPGEIGTLNDAFNSMVGQVHRAILELKIENTQCKQLEEKLRQSREFFSRAFHANPNLIALVDPATGEHLDVNDAWLETLKFSREEVIGKTSFEFDNWADINDRAQILEIHAQQGYVRDFIGKLKAKDGSVIDCSFSTDPIKMDHQELVLWTVIDITERRRFEEALRTRDAWLSAILDFAPIEIVLKDTEGKIVAISRSVADVLDLKREDFIGHTTADFFPKHVADIYMAADREVLATGKLLQQEVVVDVDGGKRYSLNAKFPLPDLDGNITGVCSLTTDLTAIREAETAVRRALVEAEKASLAKSSFLANMSHEFRTPLNAIMGFSQMLTNQYFGELGSPKYKEYADDILISSMHLLDLVNDILDLSAIEADKLALNIEYIDANEVIKECAPIITSAASDKDITYRVESPETLSPLYADRRALKQILLNVLSNAVKFTPDGGKVSLKVTMSDGHHVFEIGDSGEGIPEDKLSSITEPFVMAGNDYQRSQTGTGLGLAIVTSLVELHGGELDIKSNLGEGTTVTIMLPNTQS